MFTDIWAESSNNKLIINNLVFVFFVFFKQDLSTSSNGALSSVCSPDWYLVLPWLMNMWKSKSFPTHILSNINKEMYSCLDIFQRSLNNSNFRTSCAIWHIFLHYYLNKYTWTRIAFYLLSLLSGYITNAPKECLDYCRVL